MRWLGLSAVVLVSCVRTGPEPAAETPPPPEPVRVPEGCLDSLAGPWVHLDDPSYRYEGDDDGGTLVLHVSRLARPDAGFTPRKFRRGPERVVLEPSEAALLLLDAGASAEPADAGATDAGPVYRPDVRVELTRTPRGFVGFSLAPLLHPSGRTCEGRFPTSLISCADGGLLLETLPATALGDACQAPARPRTPAPLRHQLVRPDAG